MLLGEESHPKKKDVTTMVHPRKLKVYDTINRFLRCPKLRAYPGTMFGSSDPTKELLESMTAYLNTVNSIKKKVYSTNTITYEQLHKLLAMDDILCIVHGDGVTPRTGLIFALCTNWRVISIDPIMGGIEDPGEQMIRSGIEKKHETKLPSNLILHRGLVEDYSFDTDGFNYLAIVGVHSHANLQKLWERFNSITKIAFTMPCCKYVVSRLRSYDGNTTEGVCPELEKQTEMARFYIYE